MKILFKDFYKQNRTVKKELDTIFGRFERDEPMKENLAQLVERVNDWIDENNLKVITIETLYGKSSTNYIEFLRIWYSESEDLEEIKLEVNSSETQTDYEPMKETSSVETQTDTFNPNTTLLDLF